MMISFPSSCLLASQHWLDHRNQVRAGAPAVSHLDDPASSLSSLWQLQLQPASLFDLAAQSAH